MMHEPQRIEFSTFPSSPSRFYNAFPTSAQQGIDKKGKCPFGEIYPHTSIGAALLQAL